MITMTTFHQTQTPSSQPPSQLQLLAIQAKNQKPDSLQRTSAVTALIKEHWRQPTFGILKTRLRRQYSYLSDGLFEDLFNDALQLTLAEINGCIDKFNPQRPFLAYIRTIIRNKFSDIHRKYCNHGVTRIPNSSGNHTVQVQIISLDGLDEFIKDNIINRYLSSEGEPISDCDLLRELLIEDPDNKFQKSVEDKPHITFQYIAIQLYVEGNKMQQLASELDVHYQTLYGFFRTNLEKLEPYFRKKLQD